MKKIFALILSLFCATHLSARDVVMMAHDLGHTAFHDAVKGSGLYEHAKKKAGEDGSMAPFTVFVPTNKAFEAIKGLSPEKKKDLITFHVVPGQEIARINDMKGDGVPTVGEQLLQSNGTTIGLEDAEVRARVINGPIKADNGVIYVVDNVLLPSGMTLPQKKAASPVQQQKKSIVQKLSQTTPPQPVRHKTVVTQTQHLPSVEKVSNEQVLNAVTQLTQSMQRLTRALQQQNLPASPARVPSVALPGVQNVVVQ